MDIRFKHTAVRKIKRRWVSGVLLCVSSVLFLAFGTYYVIDAYNDCLKRKNAHAMDLVHAGATFIATDITSAIPLESKHLGSYDFSGITEELLRFKTQNQDVFSVFVFTLHEDQFSVLFDSKASSDGALSDADMLLYSETLTDNTPVVKDDNTGAWKVALAPIDDMQTGERIAVLGMKYSAAPWNSEAYKKLYNACIQVLLVLVLVAVIFVLLRKNDLLRFTSKMLDERESLLSMLFNQLPLGVALGEDDKIGSVLANDEFKRIFGRTEDKMDGINVQELSGNNNPERLARFKDGEISSYSTIKKIDKPDGQTAWINAHMVSLNKGQGNQGKSHLCIVEDVTQRILTETALRESERSKAVLLAHLPGMAYRCRNDRDWTMLFVSEGCRKLTGYEPESLLYSKEISFNDLIAPKYREELRVEWDRILPQKMPINREYEIVDKNGIRKWVMEKGQGIYDEEGNVVALEGLIIDITEQKQREAQIKHMSDHDSLTGLYNRKFFEEEKVKLEDKRYLPVSVIVANINGVRLINDAFGHAEGDRVIIEAASFMKRRCREGDVLARTGGDEFCLLLPNTDSHEAYGVLRSINEMCEQYNRSKPNRRYDVSMSLGFGTKRSIDETIELAAKEAEEYMYNRKLLNRKSSHSTILSSIMTTMYERSQETEEHAERLSRLSKKIGERLQLPQKTLDELEVFAMLHDIGKVGIDDRILNKPGKLNEEEWAVMKRHPEIGYRIAVSSPELEPIAAYILSHHERWDGNGYPQGLKGECIPLLSRILAVSDAYDAMTEDRVYRKALSKEQAIEEIKKNAGTQFDPDIAQRFVEIMS